MSDGQETPRPPETPEFGYVTPGGATHEYAPADGLSVRKFSYGSYDNNVYVIASAGEALIIDAAAPPARVESEVDGARVVGIAITHAHPDHTQALSELHARYEVPIYVHPDDSWRGEMSYVSDGDTLTVGDVTLTVTHTPGHTPGSICLTTDGFLFSGDALFPGGPGGTGGDPRRFAQAMDSLDRLFALPDATRVCPGHGLDTTLARERPYVDVWRARGW